MSRSWAFASNYLVYSAMAVYALSFLAHVIETAWAIKVPSATTKTLDYKRTEKVARIATAMMIDLPIIIISESRKIDEVMIQKANESGIAIISTPLFTHEVIIDLFQRGLL